MCEKGCNLEEVEGVCWTTCSIALFLPPPTVRAAAATAILGGLGHCLLSAPLSASSLTDRERRERSNLYCGPTAK